MATTDTIDDISQRARQMLTEAGHRPVTIDTYTETMIPVTDTHSGMALMVAAVDSGQCGPMRLVAFTASDTGDTDYYICDAAGMGRLGLLVALVGGTTTTIDHYPATAVAA